MIRYITFVSGIIHGGSKTNGINAKNPEVKRPMHEQYKYIVKRYIMLEDGQKSFMNFLISSCLPV